MKLLLLTHIIPDCTGVHLDTTECALLCLYMFIIRRSIIKDGMSPKDKYIRRETDKISTSMHISQNPQLRSISAH